MQPGTTGGEQRIQPDMPAMPSAEHMPSLPMPEAPIGPVGGIETGADRREQTAELRAAQSDAAAVANSTTQTGPFQLVNAAATAAPTDTGVVNISTPAVAAHDDVIEKEWVDKAKEIVAGTRNDPYNRGRQVSALQRDYLKKRYGKDIGAAA